MGNRTKFEIGNRWWQLCRSLLLFNLTARCDVVHDTRYLLGTINCFPSFQKPASPDSSSMSAVASVVMHSFHHTSKASMPGCPFFLFVSCKAATFFGAPSDDTIPFPRISPVSTQRPVIVAKMWDVSGKFYVDRMQNVVHTTRADQPTVESPVNWLGTLWEEVEDIEIWYKCERREGSLTICGLRFASGWCRP